MVNGYQAVLNNVFSSAGIDLAANRLISRMFTSFKKAFLTREVMPSEWNPVPDS